MSEQQKVPNALTPEEWANPSEVGYFDWEVGIVDIGGFRTDPKRLPAQLIALANAALPDSDPRKITREHIRLLRGVAADHAAEAGEDWHGDVAPLNALADALESYLPPEEK